METIGLARNNVKLEDRIQEILDLKKQRDEIDEKLAKLTGLEVANNSAPTALPHGLTLMNEIKRVFDEKGTKMRILEVKKEVDHNHRVNIPRRNIQSTMQYMVKRGILQKLDEYGMFAVKSVASP